MSCRHAHCVHKNIFLFFRIRCHLQSRLGWYTFIFMSELVSHHNLPLGSHSSTSPPAYTPPLPPGAHGKKRLSWNEKKKSEKESTSGKSDLKLHRWQSMLHTYPLGSTTVNPRLLALEFLIITYQVAGKEVFVSLTIFARMSLVTNFLGRLSKCLATFFL